MKRVLVVALVICVLLSGCSAFNPQPQNASSDTNGTNPGPTEGPQGKNQTRTDVTNESDENETTDQTQNGSNSQDKDGTTDETRGENERSNRIRISGGNLSLDPDLVYERVQSILGTNVSPPSTVIVADFKTNNRTQIGGGFYGVMGVGNLTIESNASGGFTTTTGSIFIIPRSANSSRVEKIVAHEFAHFIQFENEVVPWISLTGFDLRTTDRRFAGISTLEGSAVYVADVYTHRYLNSVNQSSIIRRRYENSTGGNKYFYARYYFGHRYVSDLVDSPKDLSRVYRNPPRTSEQVIHGYLPQEEPRRNFSIDLKITGLGWVFGSNDTMGEAFIRVALTNHLNESYSSQGADGWGNDELLTFVSAEERKSNYVWLTRWDDEKNATEFRTVFIDYLNRRAEKTDKGWEIKDENTTKTFVVQRLGNRTVAVVVGSGKFIESTRITKEDEEFKVVVRAPEE